MEVYYSIRVLFLSTTGDKESHHCHLRSILDIPVLLPLPPPHPDSFQLHPRRSISTVIQSLYFKKNVDIVVFTIFLIHILLYFDYKIKDILEHPHKKNRITTKSKVYKEKWFRLLTLELLYDCLCFTLSIVILANQDNTYETIRIVELFYLLKLYKLTVYHDKVLSLVVGT